MRHDSEGRRGWERSGSGSSKQQQVRSTYAVANRLGHVRATGADEAAVTWGVNRKKKKGRGRGGLCHCISRLLKFCNHIFE